MLRGHRKKHPMRRRERQEYAWHPAAPLKIGVIGLGDIAQKAYLPVLAAQPGVELHLHTRTPATLDLVGDTYRLPDRHTSLDALLDQGLDAAFVHAPTALHVDITERLIEAGVPAVRGQAAGPGSGGGPCGWWNWRGSGASH